MMIHEFTERTGYKPTWEEYREIEKQYYDFDGNKDEFCRDWANRYWEAQTHILILLCRELEKFAVDTPEYTAIKNVIMMIFNPA